MKNTYTTDHYETTAEGIRIVSIFDGEREIRCEFLGVVDYNNEKYVVLIPCDSTDNRVEILHLMTDSSDETKESYEPVYNDELLNTLFVLFMNKYKDQYTFE